MLVMNGAVAFSSITLKNLDQRAIGHNYDLATDRLGIRARIIDRPRFF